MQNKTYILDTNVYGELLIERNREELVAKIKADKVCVVYGVDIIEDELSKTPQEIKYKGRELRKLLIDLFETVSKEIIKFTPLAKYLAEDYFKRYKKLSKTKKYNISKEKYSEGNLKTDFGILATASLNSIDIVVSSDIRTMLSQLSKDVCKYVNDQNKLRTPNLLDYKDFKEEITKWSY